MVRTIIDEAVCPACDTRGMEYNAEQIDLPYLGESLETMLRCDSCGYRHVDFILTSTKDPMRHSIQIVDEADMSVRVVRSASGTVRLPELGIEIEPGIASDAFITNIEGILVRIERVLGQLHGDSVPGDERGKIEAMQQVMLDLREGKGPAVTLILEDPFGNSAIIDDKAVVELLTPEEAAELQTGHFVIDQSSLKEEE